MKVPLLEIIPNVNLTVCVFVCVSAWRGGCSDSLRLHSSVCIWSWSNEAESLAVVKSICRPTEWWASHSAAFSPGGHPHLSSPPAVCTVTCPPTPPPARTRAVEGHATYAADAIWKVCLTATESGSPDSRYNRRKIPFNIVKRACFSVMLQLFNLSCWHLQVFTSGNGWLAANSESCPTAKV